MASSTPMANATKRAKSWAWCIGISVPLCDRHEGAIKVADFGIAASVQNVTEDKPGVVVGKLSYMALEQARGGPWTGAAMCIVRESYFGKC